MVVASGLEVDVIDDLLESSSLILLELAKFEIKLQIKID